MAANTITLTLPDEQMDRLRAEAEVRGISADELLQITVLPLVGEAIQAMGRVDRAAGAPRRPGLDEAVEYVLEKNGELHRRLAR